MTIGERIKNRRTELGLTADEVAEQLGKSRATVYRYESGEIEKMPTTVLEPLANVLKTTPAYLMGWDDNPIQYEESEENLNAPLDVIEHFNGDAKKISEFQKIVGLDAQSEDIPETPKLRSIARLENSSFTPDEDDEILNFIKYIESKRNGGE